MMVEGLIPVIVLLPCSVPHLELHLDAVHLVGHFVLDILYFRDMMLSDHGIIITPIIVVTAMGCDKKDLNVRDIVLKDCGHVLLGELVSAQQDDDY